MSCIELSLVLLEKSIFYGQSILLAKLLSSILIHFLLQGPICLLLHVSLDFLLCIPVPYDENNFFFFFAVT